MNRVYCLIAATTLCFSTALMAQNDADKHTAITPQEFVWVDGPDGLPAGAKMVILEGNPSKVGPFTMRVKAPANYKIPAHSHPAIEHVTVLQGSLHMGVGDKLDETKGKELSVGSFAVMPTHMHHYAWTGNEEVIIQLHGIGPWGIAYINPNDDPRKNKK